MAGVQILSYELMKNLDSAKRISKILEIVKTGSVVVLEGRLASEEETNLISNALSSISGRFSGIEIAYLDTTKPSSFIEKIKDRFVKLLAKERIGITVIGPSKIIKEIKMDPNKLEVLFK